MPELIPGCRQPAGAAIEDVDRAGKRAVRDVLVWDADRQIAAAVAVEIAYGQGLAEELAHAGGVEDTGAVLAPELVAGRRQTPRAAVEDVDRAGIVDAPDVLAGDADRQIVAPVAIEIARGQGAAEYVVRLGGVEDTGAVLAPELVSGRREAIGAAVEDVDRARDAGAAHALVRDADRQIVAAVAVEVARGQGVAEVVEGLAAVEDTGAVLAPERVSGPREAIGAAVEHVDRAGAVDAADVLTGDADRQIGAAVAVEVAANGAERRCRPAGPEGHEPERDQPGKEEATRHRVPSDRPSPNGCRSQGGRTRGALRRDAVTGGSPTGCSNAFARPVSRGPGCSMRPTTEPPR